MADNNNNTNTSTLQSYVDSAKGATQSVVGSMTGNQVDKNQGEQRQEKANAEKDLSHTTAKAGPYTASSEGAVAKDDPNRTAGSWNQTVGSGKEYLGNLTGSEQMKKEGIQQNQDGKAQEAQGQLSDYASGMGDRVQGSVGGAAAALTGNRQEQQKRMDQHDVGKTLQRGAESDIQKQA